VSGAMDSLKALDRPIREADIAIAKCRPLTQSGHAKRFNVRAIDLFDRAAHRVTRHWDKIHENAQQLFPE